jgi:LAS superfamily LD-carboxypeptidase LdcB
MSIIKPADLLNTDNVLNDLQGSSIGPLINRSLTTTDAISSVLEAYYTPDVLAGKTRFPGYIMKSEVTDSPIIYDQQESMSWLAATGGDLEKSVQLPADAVFYRYRVALGAQLDARDSGMGSSGPRPKNALTVQERLDCLPEAYLALPGASQATSVAPLQPGTYVEMVLMNRSRFQGYAIIKVGRKNLTINTDDPNGLKVSFDRSPPQLMNRGGNAPSPNDPGIYSWSNRAKQKKAIYLPTKETLYNGDLESSGLLATDQETGAKLIKDAMPDFKRMAAAYKARWSHTLFCSGYRTYNGQVNARMVRVKGDAQNCAENRYGNGTKGEGAGERNANCKFVGYAAIPGTSNHGWGAAVDINRPKAGFTQGMAGNSPQFQWLNKYGPEHFNFNFGVSGEHWHMDWLGWNSVVSGVKVRTTRWTQAGVNAEISFA